MCLKISECVAVQPDVVGDELPALLPLGDIGFPVEVDGNDSWGIIRTIQPGNNVPRVLKSKDTHTSFGDGPGDWRARSQGGNDRIVLTERLVGGEVRSNNAPLRMTDELNGLLSIPAISIAARTARFWSVSRPPTPWKFVSMSCGFEAPTPHFCVPRTTTLHDLLLVPSPSGVSWRKIMNWPESPEPSRLAR